MSPEGFTPTGFPTAWETTFSKGLPKKRDFVTAGAEAAERKASPVPPIKKPADLVSLRAGNPVRRILILVLFVTITRATILDRLGTTELERTPHELLATELLNGAASLIRAAHGDKSEAFRALGAAVDYDF